jgi:hypothetical protein
MASTFICVVSISTRASRSRSRAAPANLLQPGY